MFYLDKIVGVIGVGSFGIVIFNLLVYNMNVFLYMCNVFIVDVINS